VSPINQQSILGRYISLAGANFLSAIFGFLVAALLARQFGPAGFGAISLATTLVSYAIVLSNCGTVLHAVRTVAMGQSSLEQMIPAVISIRLLLSIVVFMLLVAAAYLIPQLFESRQLIVLFGLTLFSNAVLLIWVPQAIHRTHAISVSRVMLQFLNLCLLYLFLQFSSSLYVAPAALIIAEIVVAFGLMLSIRSYVTGVNPLPSFGAMKEVLRESAPIGMTQLVRALALASDLLILGLMTVVADVGIYATAYKLYLFLLSLGGAYFVILLPRIAELAASNSLMLQELRLSFKRSLPIVAGVIIIIWFIADLLIELLFGAGYGEAANVLRILSLAMLANIIGRHFRQVLLARKMQAIDLKQSSISAGVHLLSKVLLIPFFGIIGCALGTLIGEITLIIGQALAVRKVTANGGRS
jgi:O-antigen/teichoic acid export membrane protein